MCFLLTKCCSATTNEEHCEAFWKIDEITLAVKFRSWLTDVFMHPIVYIEVVLIWPDRIKVVFQSSHGHLYSVWSHLFFRMMGDDD